MSDGVSPSHANTVKPKSPFAPEGGCEIDAIQEVQYVAQAIFSVS